MSKMRYGRLTREFLLLFLAEEAGCGTELQRRFDELIPFNRFDSAIIYRSLAILDEEGLVTFQWDTSGSGPARKVFSITGEGLKKLSEYRPQVELRMRNLGIFIERFDRLEREGRF